MKSSKARIFIVTFLLSLCLSVLPQGTAQADRLSELILGTAQAAEKTHTNSIGIEFVLIPSGSFTLGADKNVEAAKDRETPQHRVNISKDFYLGKYEVTQQQWVAVMGSNPCRFNGLSNPVEQVSWDDAQEFIRRLNQQEGHNRYRLPTEAEWEYPARAGTTSTYYFGDDVGSLSDYAWFDGNSDDTTHPVGQKQPNAWGRMIER
jgi:formylglycine-generating enzyme required for sulfatase activity